MLKLTRKSLLISSILLLILSCSPKHAEGISNKMNERYVVPYFNEPQAEYKYDASIQVYGNDLHGFFLLKRLGDQHARMALVSDFGNTLMDFEFKGEEVIVHYVIEDLNKKIIVNKLKKYFQLITQSEYELTFRYPKRIDNMCEPKTLSYIESIPTRYKSSLNNRTVFLMINHKQVLSKIIQSKRRKTIAEVDFYTSNTPDDSIQLDSLRFESKKMPIVMTFKAVD
ncbi:MAG: hypothetical protein H3C31_08280 [Brumimicrobium sp.]|nr:hypothetical protein [Brumimicrobium sp.]MCO5268996.1 hypothetical protein [Brumimicrobium sp.]